MLRVFTRDVGRRYLKGDVKDFSILTWRGIAQSAGEPLAKFSRAINDLVRDLDDEKSTRQFTAAHPINMQSAKRK